jgi:hypothetical protein
VGTTTVVTPVPPVQIPVRELAPYALFAGAILFVLLYLVGVEQGAVSLISGRGIHEYIHDARHLLGVPCH